MTALNLYYVSEDSRIFIDYSNVSPKAILIHNAIKLHSLPLGHTAHTERKL